MSNRNFRCNATLYSPVNGGSIQSSELGPISSSHCFSISRNQTHALSVGVLFAGSRPLAVFLAVIAIVVDSVNRVPTARSLSHVLEESFKSTPSLAIGYSTATIVLVPLVVRVITPVFHVCPRAVLWRDCIEKTISVGHVPFGYTFVAKTATTASAARLLYKGRSKHRGCVAAVATANPPRSLSLNAIETKHKQPTKSLPAQVVPNHTLIPFMPRRSYAEKYTDTRHGRQAQHALGLF